MAIILNNNIIKVAFLLTNNFILKKYIIDKTNDDIKRLIGNEFTLSSKLCSNITNVIR